jgi:4-hydroxybenzoate polyprenyltransferase
MRPKQWSKNIFIFAALVFDSQLMQIDSILRTLAAILLFSLTSSAVYIMNDLADIESDRQHPTKKFRPLPAGTLNKNVARVASFVFAVGSLTVAYLLSPKLATVLLIYLVIQIAYTFHLKHVVLLDVMLIASGFVLRVAAGVAVINVQRFSPWLYVFMGLLALFLALGKRRHELVLLGENAGNHRAILQEYNLDLIDRLIGIVTTGALITYSLYTFLAEGLPENHAMMLTIPFVLYAIFRYLYLIHVRKEGGIPEEIFLGDRPLQLSMGLWSLIVLATLYIL